MKFLTKRKIILVSISIVLMSVALGAFGENRLRGSNHDIYHDLEMFANILERVQSDYVDTVDTHELVRKAIDGMLGDLDPHSQYLDGLAYQDLMVSTRGKFGGLGIFISYRNDYPTVISPIEGTPGARAGLRSGDQIVDIEGHDTKGWRTDRAVKYLRGAPGTTVSFKVRRPGDTVAIDYSITREVIKVHSVPFHGMFGGHIGYVKINSFARNTAAELSSAVTDMEKQGMKGLVVDLRGNPGGLLQAAKDVSELFLDKDRLIVYTKGRMPNSSHKFYSSNRHTHRGYPIVMMINGGTASAAEIFSGAMQDWDRAFVVGEPSYGKGTVQTVFNLSDSEAVKLTTAKYYTPSGRSIHRPRKKNGEPLGAIASGARTDQGKDVPNGSTESQIARPGADELRADSTAGHANKNRPEYHTAAGRVVYGGGGITPDFQLTPPKYTVLERRLERDALGFSFIVEYLQNHEIHKGFKVTDAVLNDFYAYLKKRKFEYKSKDLTDENVAYIRMMIGREAANNQLGRDAMYRVVLNADPEFNKVLSIFRDAPTLEKMFAYGEQQRAIKKASID